MMSYHSDPVPSGETEAARKNNEYVGEIKQRAARL